MAAFKDIEYGSDGPVRILFCTSGGAFGTRVLRRLLDSGRVQVTGVVLSTRILSPRYGWLRGACAQIRRSGPRYALYLWAATDLAEALGGSVRNLARRHGIPVHCTRDINAPEGLAFVAGGMADLLLTAFFNQRVGARVRSATRRGGINIHPGRLPELRGVDPVFFAKLRGGTDFCVTLHELAEDFDTGPILATAEMTTAPGDSVFRDTLGLFRRGADLLLERLDEGQWRRGGRPQPPGGAYDSWPSPVEVRDLGRRGVSLMRWRDLLALVRSRIGA